MKTTFRALTLRGDRVEKGIVVKNGFIPFAPRSGMTRSGNELLAATSVEDGVVGLVHVATTPHGAVLVPSNSEAAERELVLVQEYSNGCGGKRWPSFGVEFGDEVVSLSSTETFGGSGHERWTLVVAPLGWAENIAGQFVNARDYGGQTISYKPDLSGEAVSGGKTALAAAFARAGLHPDSSDE